MGTVHQLINDGGRQGALNFGVERTEVEAAITYMADEEGGIGFLYSGWCQTALPHRRLPDTDGWQIETERTTLIVEPGVCTLAAGVTERLCRQFHLRPSVLLPSDLAGLECPTESRWRSTASSRHPAHS